MLPLYVNILKRVDNNSSLFHKLMGDHDVENAELVDSFFSRYKSTVLSWEGDDFNPLLVYLPETSFSDLAFIASREDFFKRQTIVHINEFLHLRFKCKVDFNALNHEDAWSFFWEKIMAGGT